jgi:hypothetical protein
MSYKNIVYHWTAGNYNPCPANLELYHFIVDGHGEIIDGKFKPSDNVKCITGKYAAHCGGGNTGRIGISICCMKDLKTPPTRVQIEAMCSKGAECCIKYGLQPKDCITHAEFGAANPKTSSFGKVDITSIPYENITGIKACANYLRGKTQVYYNRLKVRK